MSRGMFWGHISRKNRQSSKQNENSCFRGTCVPLSICLSVMISIINNSMSEMKTAKQLDPGKGKRAAGDESWAVVGPHRAGGFRQRPLLYTVPPVHVDA